MTGRRGRGPAIAVALSAAAHLLVLAILAVQAPRLRERPEASVASTVLPVFLLPRRVITRAAPSPAAIRGHQAARATDEISAPVVVSTSPPAEAAGPAVITPGLQTALRRQLGCAERSGIRLARDERGDCDERLGRGAAAAPHLKAPIAPELRHYWDQVAEAKEPQGPLPPLKARGRLGLFEAMPTGMKGHGPGFGCKFQLGFGKARPKIPPHALRLGRTPCFIEPPAGSLSPDVDVQNPDEVVLHRQP